jgi:hypothetical protein
MKSATIFTLLRGMAVFAAVMFAISCTHKPDLQDVPEICFESEVLPIFLNSCAISGCHDGSGEPDLVLNSYSNIMRGIKAGDPDGSKIYKSITRTSGEDKMPPDQPLSADNRTIIRLWIEQGAKETTCQ